jgi:hypothetical protein
MQWVAACFGLAVRAIQTVVVEHVMTLRDITYVMT